MLDNTTRQWLDENEVLERHLLNRLTADETDRLQKLLQSFPELADELEFQKMIIAGIRQNGRLELKERLKSNIAQSKNHSSKTFVLYSYLKIAAVVAVLIGVSWIVYSRIAAKPEPAPSADIKKEAPPKELKIEQPKIEKSVDPKTGGQQQIASKKSTGKQNVQEKPLIVSTPSETAAVKHKQKLNIESLKFLKPNELTVSVNILDEKKTLETKLFFKNPTDLTAVNIKETQSEKDNQLEWFYVIYENRVLNLYLDNTQYLKVFKNASLEETSERLVIKISSALYTVDLKSKDKFKKAVLTK